MLDANLRLAEKMIALVESGMIEPALSEQLVGDALENVVSSIDGFGRELVRVRASSAVDKKQALSISFQDLSGARKNVQAAFGVDLAACVSDEEWKIECRGFQKRHVISHRMGVVDDTYLAATQGASAVRGRKLVVQASEVIELVSLVRRIVAGLHTALGERESPT